MREAGEQLFVYMCRCGQHHLTRASELPAMAAKLHAISVPKSKAGTGSGATLAELVTALKREGHGERFQYSSSRHRVMP